MSELTKITALADTLSARRPEPNLALHPHHPERICWGCDKYCRADDLRCGNGTIRTQHPVELFGEDWMEWELEPSPLSENAAK